jgi:NAD(P)H-hydrate epimerase
LNIRVVEILNDDDFTAQEAGMRHQNMWIDAILGTGLNTDVKGLYRRFIEFINNSKQPILSVDIPSGLNADTGQPCGVCINAHTTVTFAFAKCGHYLYPGAAYTGDLHIIDIGIPPHIVNENEPRQQLLSRDRVRSYWTPRAADAHKGNAGHLLVLAGSPGKTGAAAMTALSAMRIGCGLVSLGIPRGLNPILEGQILEVMTCPLPQTVDGFLDEASFTSIMELLSDKKCLAIGPGIGTDGGVKKLCLRVLKESTCPVVIDADALNHLAGNIDELRSIKGPVVLTPHPGEMARLSGKSVGDIQKDRIESARNFSLAFKVHTVLKGARTIVAHPDGEVYVNPTGNSGMASGGMGDVLTGLVAGLIAQGYPLVAATHMAVYLHGMAADTLSKTRGPFGFLASDVMHRIPDEIGLLLS